MELPLDERDDAPWEMDVDVDRQQDAVKNLIDDFADYLLAGDLGTPDSEMSLAIDRIYTNIRNGTTRQDLIQIVMQFVLDRATDLAEERLGVMEIQIEYGDPVALIQEGA